MKIHTHYQKAYFLHFIVWEGTTVYRKQLWKEKLMVVREVEKEGEQAGWAMWHQMLVAESMHVCQWPWIEESGEPRYPTLEATRNTGEKES